MSTAKVTVEFDNGDTREFIASDGLEELIKAGEIFSINTLHSSLGDEVGIQVSKMYAGNPVAALGHMMMMRKNAEQLDDGNDEYKNVVIEVITACIKFLSDEITSHQSGMVSVADDSTSEDTGDDDGCS